jgi:chitinase
MNRYVFILMGFLIFGFAGCKKEINSSVSTYKGRIISYIRTWELRKDNGKNIFWKAEDIDGKMLTDLNIAFAVIKNGDDLTIESLHWEDGFFNLFEEIQKLKENYPFLRINLSIGGWGADGFSDMAASENLRAHFIDNVVEWVEKYGFDGVDIDWEYPVDGAGGVIKSRPEDKTNFTLLMKGLEESLNTLSDEKGKTYTLSFAAAASSDYLGWIEPKKLAEIVDYVNIMSYDFYGEWSGTTGHHSNLYNSDIKPNALSGDKAVRDFIAAGFSSNQVVLGIPFFGKGWQGVINKNNGLYQRYKSVFNYKDMGYEDLEKLIVSENLKEYWDDSAKAPYLYNGDIWISYDNEKSVKIKTDYIKKNNLGGIMIWEYSHDFSKKLLTVIYQNIKKKTVVERR